MDPISLIVTALATGAAAVGKDTVSLAVKDAYEGLRSLIKSRFAGKPEAEIALKEHASDPDTWEKPLRSSLSAATADRDSSLIEAAQALLKVTDPEGAVKGKYQIQMTGNIRGVSQGDHNLVNMTFGTDDDE